MDRWHSLHPWTSGIAPLCWVVEVPACAAGITHCVDPAPRRPDLFDCAAAWHCVLQFVWKFGHSACDLDRDFRQQILCMSPVWTISNTLVTHLMMGVPILRWVTPVWRQ